MSAPWPEAVPCGWGRGGDCTEGAILSLNADCPGSFSDSKVNPKAMVQITGTYEISSKKYLEDSVEPVPPAELECFSPTPDESNMQAEETPSQRGSIREISAKKKP